MKKIISLLCAFAMLASAAACSDSDPGGDPVPGGKEYELSLSPAAFAEVPAEGSGDAPLVLTLRTTAPSWSVVRAEDNDWALPNISVGLAGEHAVRISVAANGGEARSTSFTVRATGCDDLAFSVLQAGAEIPPAPVFDDPDAMPDRIEADASGMESDAMTLAAKMTAGINIGNTLEACDNKGSADMTVWSGSETTWGNPQITQTLIDGYKAAGFDAVRIPVAWVCGHISDFETWKIDLAWLARVREVVDYCRTADMYVLINIHWDGGWLENNPTYARQEEVNAMQRRLWTQIAKYFRDYDEHLLFAGTNEVHADYGTPTDEHIAVQQSFNQTFVDAVRDTGGRNAFRVLVTQTYNTNIWLGAQKHVMSRDRVEGRQMLEVHCYDPWSFCGDDPSASTWGSDAEIETLRSQFTQLGSFYDAGIPFILGEYGALYQPALKNREGYMASRCKWIFHATKFAVENGYVPFVWDTGSDVMNRSTGTPHEIQQPYLDALMRGARGEAY
ncbi:MAG: cellulase family glycosylhydrolase [Alistipes sp.]|nr:cellulase family glycosylhydrolase [Alistipes senegalensis]MCM1250985.1 cellulase family glycosylhydrolase [Alistipes sp.]